MQAHAIRKVIAVVPRRIIGLVMPGDAHGGDRPQIYNRLVRGRKRRGSMHQYTMQWSWKSESWCPQSRLLLKRIDWVHQHVHPHFPQSRKCKLLTPWEIHLVTSILKPWGDVHVHSEVNCVQLPHEHQMHDFDCRALLTSPDWSKMGSCKE